MTTLIDQLTARPFTISRVSLLGNEASDESATIGESDVAAAVALARRIVANADTTCRVMQVRVGSARSVDLWAGETGIALHSFRSDSTEPTAGSVHDRAFGATVLHELGFAVHESSDSAEIDQPVTRTWESPAGLIDDVVSGEVGDVNLTALSTMKGHAISGLVVVTRGSTTSWSPVVTGEPVQLRSGDFGRLWTLLSSAYLPPTR